MGAGLGPEGVFNEDAFEDLFGSNRDGQRLPQESVKMGDRVFLHGLLRAELNGRFAIVLNGEPFGGRFHLRLLDDQAEVRAKRHNFTKVVCAPSDVVDVDEVDGGTMDTSTLLRGDCCICLGQKEATQAALPCGHLCLCKACAIRARTAQGKCPICRKSILDIVQVYLPKTSATEDGELEKAIDRCRKAEKRATELELLLQTASAKRARRAKKAAQGEGAKEAERTGEARRLPEEGGWVELPALGARSASDLLWPKDVEYSRLFGEVVSTDTEAASCVVRFRSVDVQAYVEHGRKKPGTDAAADRCVTFPLNFSFQAVYTPEEAKTSVSAADMYGIFDCTKTSRKNKLRRDRQAELKRIRAGDSPRTLPSSSEGAAA
jgi:hypothetical protein